jgi:putative intracellular protease/amidase
MKLRIVIWGVLGAVALGLLGLGIWIASLPPAPAAAAAQASAIPEHEVAATLAALRPPKRARPLVAIVGINDATETTDYLMPYGILRRSGVADVMALATEPGPVTLYPALKVEPDATIASFDAQHPEGADYVLVPAMTRDDDPDVLRWIRSQAQKGAIVIGVCVGATVVGAAGLLAGKRATTHWFSLADLREATPSLRYVADRRFVVDDRVATTTGISASMPMTLTLIEAIAGRAKAEAVARELGVAHWDARHDSGAFRFTRPFALTVLGNILPFWQREQLGIELTAGVDEVSLALVADAWSRTYRSRALTFAGSPQAQVTRSGLRVLPDRALQAIARRYGKPTERMVAMQLEYPSQNGSAM